MRTSHRASRRRGRSPGRPQQPEEQRHADEPPSAGRRAVPAGRRSCARHVAGDVSSAAPVTADAGTTKRCVDVPAAAGRGGGPRARGSASRPARAAAEEARSAAATAATGARPRAPAQGRRDVVAQREPVERAHENAASRNPTRSRGDDLSSTSPRTTTPRPARRPPTARGRVGDHQRRRGRVNSARSRCRRGSRAPPAAVHAGPDNRNTSRAASRPKTSAPTGSSAISNGT